MKKRFARMTALIMSAVLMAGCGSSGSASSAASAASSSGSAAASAAQTGETLSVAESVGGISDSATESIISTDTLTDEVTLASARTGDLSSVDLEVSPEEMTSDEADDMDRAIRAYKQPDTSLLVNEAEEFYYYESLDENLQRLYDAMFLVASNPEADKSSFAVSITTSVDPNSDEFLSDFFTAYFAMVYDHPELFWLYNFMETTMSAGAAKSGSGWKVYLFLDKPFEDYEKQMTAFNDAADDFLDDIDTNQSEREMARDVHDKLMDLVTYDTSVYESKEGQDLAHTAYGSLVEDSDGNKNNAVCDGYALAYEYLLQQLGINALVVPGIAGTTRKDAGGHAWNMAYLDGKWYEIDCTYDDDDGSYAKYASDTSVKPIIREMLSDKDYVDNIQHAYFGLTTKRMRNFKPSSKEVYTASDGKRYSILPTTVHIRDSEAGTGLAKLGVELTAPTAR